jgi:hypothetical protein
VGEKSSMGGTQGTIREPLIKPKRGGRAIVDIDIGNGPESIEFIINNFPKITMSPCSRGVKRGSISEQPFFPGSRLIREEFVNEFHEQAAVLKLQVFHS